MIVPHQHESVRQSFASTSMRAILDFISRMIRLHRLPASSKLARPLWAPASPTPLQQDSVPSAKERTGLIHRALISSRSTTAVLSRHPKQWPLSAQVSRRVLWTVSSTTTLRFLACLFGTVQPGQQSKTSKGDRECDQVYCEQLPSHVESPLSIRTLSRVDRGAYQCRLLFFRSDDQAFY